MKPFPFKDLDTASIKVAGYFRYFPQQGQGLYMAESHEEDTSNYALVGEYKGQLVYRDKTGNEK